jgi:hypothetical protein
MTVGAYHFTLCNLSLDKSESFASGLCTNAKVFVAQVVKVHDVRRIFNLTVCARDAFYLNDVLCDFGLALLSLNV